LHVPLLETGPGRVASHLVTVGAHTLFEQLPRDLQRLLIDPFARASLFPLRQYPLLPTRPAQLPRAARGAARAGLHQVGATEMLPQRLVDGVQVTMRYITGRIVLVEAQ